MQLLLLLLRRNRLTRAPSRAQCAWVGARVGARVKREEAAAAVHEGSEATRGPLQELEVSATGGRANF